MLTRRRLLALGQLGGGGVAPPASYTYPEGTLFGEVERLDTSGDYSLECGSGGESLPVEFVNNAAGVTISADTDWGSATADERLLAVRVRGDLTIDEGYSLTAAARKLGLLIFVDGNLTVNGIIDMSARGANHSATGSDLTAFDVRLYEASAEVANLWPAAGGAGAAHPEGVDAHGITGTAGTDGGAGGGGSGARRAAGSPSGAGAAATGYSSGTGGGGRVGSQVPTSGGFRGGSGGLGASSVADAGGGGAGNPGGNGGVYGSGNRVAYAGDNGTGGAVFVYAAGNISIGATGIVRANGSDGGDTTGAGGGGSGGGSVSLYHVGTYTNDGTVQANGGAGGDGAYNGGAGGAGSIREVTL